MQAAPGAHNRATDMPAMQEEAEYLCSGLRSHSFSSQFRGLVIAPDDYVRVAAGLRIETLAGGERPIIFVDNVRLGIGQEFAGF
jgi:hypothetical protein